jgi:hypothetical protein
MKKKSTSQPVRRSLGEGGFFNLRVLIGMFVALAGIALALVATANPRLGLRTSPAARTLQASSHARTDQAQQKYNPAARSIDISMLPPGFDCSKIHQLRIDTMENLGAQRIMIACGKAQGGKPASPATAFSKFVKSLLPSPLAYGGTDVDLITGTESFPAVTQSETYTLASPEDPSQIVVAYNDSSGAGGSPQNYAGASVSTDGGLTFTRLNPNPFAAAGDNFGDPVVLYNTPTHTWFIVWLTPACGGGIPGGVGYYKSTDPSNPASWTFGCIHNNTQDDRESGWSDNNPSSPFFGRMYVSWNDYNVLSCGDIGCLFAAFSTDNGATWSSPVQVSPNGTESRNTQITGDMSGNGDLYIGGMNENGGFGNLARNILMYKSTDGGVSWANPFTSDTFDGAGVTAVGYFECMFTDNGGYWRHMSWGEPAAFNGVVSYVYSQHGTGSDAGDVYYIRSTDGGVTFATPFKLNTDATTRPQWQANLSVSPAGTLLATWYDGRDFPSCTYGDPNTPCYKMYSRKSNDNGANWLPDEALSDVGSPLPAQPDFNVQGTYAGDYDYGSAILTKHVTSWVDGRVAISGTSQQDAFTDRELVGFAVTTADPACGSVVSTQPTEFTVNLSDAVNAGTVDPSDFTVNGIAADTADVSGDNLSITFTFNTSPVTTQGEQTMHIPTDSFTRQSDNQGNFEFECTFRFDETALAVTDTVPPVGGTFDPPGPADYTFDMNFNEEVDPSSVQTTDLHLSGIPGSTVTNVTVLPGNTTAEFTIHIGSIFSGTLTVNLPAGAITDTFGNGNEAFTGNYEYVGTAPKGCGLLVGSGMTTGFPFHAQGWAPILASNTVQYTFALSQPAANDFALFETHDPWLSTVLKDAITSNGHTYTEFTPADLATVNFSDYRVVILNWDDTNLPEFITPYTAAIPFLEAYASSGGVVWVQGAIQGNPGENYPMPFGGQGNKANGDSDSIVDPASPMMIGMPNPIEGNSASHVSFTDLPGSAHIVVMNPTNNQPALYDLQFGGACGGTPTPSPTVTPSATPTATASVTPSATPTATPTATASVTPSATPTATASVTPSATPTATPTATPGHNPTPRPRPTPHPRPTP